MEIRQLFNMLGNKITNLGAPSSNSDASTKKYVDDEVATRVSTTTKVNGHALTGDVNVTKADLSLDNVTNDQQVKASDVDTNTSLGVSDIKVPSQKAVKAYADGLVANAVSYEGGYDASGNTFPSGAKKGSMRYITVPGTLAGKDVEIGDAIIANKDAPTSSDWNILQTNIDYTPEDSANKEGDVETHKASTTKYPTMKGIVDWIINKAYATVSAMNAKDDIVEQRNSDKIKFWYGTQAQYTGIATPDANTIYLVKKP